MPRTASRTVGRRAAQARFVVLTGLSGAGKSQAIRALEDLGYFCVDNLPSTLIPTMAELASRAESGLEKVALVVDVRERDFLSQFPRVFRRIRRMPASTRAMHSAIRWHCKRWMQRSKRSSRRFQKRNGFWLRIISPLAISPSAMVSR